MTTSPIIVPASRVTSFRDLIAWQLAMNLAVDVHRSHVGIALGSTGELDTQLEIAVRLSYLSSDVSQRLLMASANVGRLLHGLWKSLE